LTKKLETLANPTAPQPQHQVPRPKKAPAQSVSAPKTYAAAAANPPEIAELPWKRVTRQKINKKAAKVIIEGNRSA
jgi:hypothetical protein